MGSSAQSVLGARGARRVMSAVVAGYPGWTAMGRLGWGRNCRIWGVGEEGRRRGRVSWLM